MTGSVVPATRAIFADQKKLADRAIAQLSDEEIFARANDDANSIGVIMKHVGGNLRSRWSDFLTSDGEKPDRNRDGEFEVDGDTPAAIRAVWEEGWSVLDAALASLTDADLDRTITIRSEPHSAILALQRSLAHTAHHVGQIVLLAKTARGSAWKTLSIARGQSGAFTAGLQQKHEPPSASPSPLPSP
jgi:hypothetical protein